jgi:hypothetical protein
MAATSTAPPIIGISYGLVTPLNYAHNLAISSPHREITPHQSGFE